MTKLDKPLRREILIGRHAYVVTLTPLGLKLVQKGRRKGYELTWESLISGDAELAVALRAATAKAPPPPETGKRPARATKRSSKRRS
jgi:hypothetical protein